MYVIATVCMLKLYQARHPDITAKSHTTWMVLSIVVIIGVGGVVSLYSKYFLNFTHLNNFITLSSTPDT